MSISSNFPTLRPSLLLDFANSGRLDPRVTFTRASTATYFDETGVLQSAAIDAPRFDYDPATLAARGFLIEEPRTNSIRNNTMQGAVAGTPGTAPTGWVSVATTVSGVSASIEAVGSENGIAYVDVRYQGTYSGSTGTAFTPGFDSAPAIAASDGQTWTTSAYITLVSGSLSDVTLNFRWNNQVPVALADSSVLNVVSGVLRANRFERTITVNDPTITGISPRLRVALVNGQTYDFTLRIGMPQLELGAFATSVIPTTTTALTRSADVASVNTLSPWYNATESTLFMEVTPVGVRSVSSPIVTIDDGTTSNRIAMSITAANAMQNSTVVSGALSGNTTTPSTTYAANSTYKIAFAVKLDDVQSFSNGAAGSIDTTALIPSGLTALKFTAQGASTGLNNVWMRRFTYYPRRLSAAEGAAITA